MSERRRARAQMVTVSEVPLRLQRFIVSEWATEGEDVPGEDWARRGVRLYRRYAAARRAWAAEHGLTMVEMRHRYPRRTAVDR